jgi:hypothetical protein
MKKTLLSAALLFILFCTKISAQTTVPTWYVIPPTNGCNGVWAVDASVFGGCGSVSTYIMSPPGCVQMTNNTVADTTYWVLCSFPCNLTMMGPSGIACICGTGTMTGLEPTSSEYIVTAYPNPTSSDNGWNILLDGPGHSVEVNIYNSVGQLVSTQSTQNADQIFRISTTLFNPGTYFTETVVDGAPAYRQRLILTQ